MAMTTSRAVSTRVRAFLLASAATTSMMAGGTARAQDVTGKPDGSILEAQSAASTVHPSIVIATPGTPTTALDPVKVNGVGQMVIDEKNGFIGLCTGTLINPRTVIFAAHCVNENPAGTGFQDPWGYGAAQGGLPISFGFSSNNRPALVAWLNAGAQQYKTVTSNYLYNVNQVLYNADSTKLGIASNFLQGDVAIASLDTPAANVPAWAILLSALPVPASINGTTGTGYHVTVEGYGNNGTGTAGSTGAIDYRRRAAENYVGLLGSLDDLDLFLFGAPDGLPQNLYQLDLDDPRRGTAAASPYDFNVFKDKALPKEGITGPGDSGGPLILDRTFSKQTVIAVLSGGDRFYGAQPSGSYGTTSFYQPLYLFWDYVAANNPYRYVAAQAGDGAWTDPAHWVTTLDPAYQVISNGQLVNGIPTSPGAGITGTAGKFGQICFDTRTASDCYDVSTGVETVGRPSTATDAVPAGTQTVDAIKEADIGGVAAVRTNNPAKVTDSGLTSILEAQDGAARTASLGASESTSQAATGIQAAAALPAATLANGLPGASNFVPQNVDPVAATKTNARYYDVTLSATGNTTLNSAATIDRFTVSGGGAKLTVGTSGSLTSLMGISQLTGAVQNDGVITSRGDYLLMTGALSGSGSINTPFFTSASGMIAPGTVGTVGTLTFGGNLILASGNRLLVDLGPNGTSDKIAVVATTFTGTGGTTPVDGLANIGGIVGFAPAAGYTIRSGDIYTILTSQGGISGRFAAPVALSAILTPRFIYSANAVQVAIDAGLYANVVQRTPVQTAYAQLLDQNRTNYGALSSVYGTLDLQNAATIQGTLESLAPRTEATRTALGTASIDNASRFYREHLASLDPGNLGGTLAVIGKPFEMAALNLSGMPGAQQVRSDSGNAVLEGKLPETMSGFVAGGYIDGHSAGMRTARPTGRDQFDGWFAAGGIESEVSPNGVIGLSLSYTKLDASPFFAGDSARSELFEGTLYGKAILGSVVLDAMTTAGSFDSRTVRSVNLVGTPYRLVGNDRSLVLSSEVGLGEAVDFGPLTLAPRAAIRGTAIFFDRYKEEGGGPALVYDRDRYTSVQGRLGFKASAGKVFKPFASAYVVHDFDDQPSTVGANFVGGIGPDVLFALAGQDKDWAEVGGGLEYKTGNIQLSVAADTTLGRYDVTNQSYHGTVKVSF